MYENQLIELQTGFDTTRRATPVVMSPYDDEGITICIPLTSGVTIQGIAILSEDQTHTYASASGISVPVFDIFGGEYMTPGLVPYYERVYLWVKLSNGNVYYSQPLIRVKADELALVAYSCEEDALGFPFKTEDIEVHAYFPILLSKPQSVQEDKTYVRADGKVTTLFAKYYKEWEGETDYLDERTHDKIVAALSCDTVFINGRYVAKSEKYDIKWDQYDLSCDGETKLAKATFKVREQKLSRNSNYSNY